MYRVFFKKQSHMYLTVQHIKKCMYAYHRKLYQRVTNLARRSGAKSILREKSRGCLVIRAQPLQPKKQHKKLAFLPARNTRKAQ